MIQPRNQKKRMAEQIIEMGKHQEAQTSEMIESGHIVILIEDDGYDPSSGSSHFCFLVTTEILQVEGIWKGETVKKL